MLRHYLLWQVKYTCPTLGRRQRILGLSLSCYEEEKFQTERFSGKDDFHSIPVSQSPSFLTTEIGWQRVNVPILSPVSPESPTKGLSSS